MSAAGDADADADADAARLDADGSVRAARWMVATGHPLAARAAARMLRDGGSAIDAAIAADAVMGVVEPMATGIGGDLLAMVVEPDGRADTYNGTGRSPAALDAARVAALAGGRIPERHPLSVTTPGAVRGWADLHARWGRLEWAPLFAPAIEAAADGFAVAPVAAREWALFEAVLRVDPNCAALYRAGAVPRAGERHDNPALARVLQTIAAEGADAFYAGEPARAAQAACVALGGVLTAEDLARHRGEFRAPLSARFRGLEVLECPPNTHGLAVLEALEALEALALDPDDPQTMVAAVRAMAKGQARAREVVADPAGNTVCTVVVDAEGLAVTLMTSVFKRFGSGIAVPNCGFVLQNRGFGFAEPGRLNGAGPSRRPFHTVVPAAARVDGRFRLGLGVVGGAMQPQGQLQILLRLAAWRQTPQAALDAPRWRLESERALAIEAGMPAAIEQALRAAGYVDPKGAGELGGRSDFGGAQLVMRDPASDELVGASDRRKDGLALGG